MLTLAARAGKTVNHRDLCRGYPGKSTPSEQKPWRAGGRAAAAWDDSIYCLATGLDRFRSREAGVLSFDCEEASNAPRLALAKTCFAVHIGVSGAASLIRVYD